MVCTSCSLNAKVSGVVELLRCRESQCQLLPSLMVFQLIHGLLSMRTQNESSPSLAAMTRPKIR